MDAFLNPSIPIGSLHSLWGAWHTRFKKIVFVSAPAHLLTVISCIINLTKTASPSSSYLPFFSSTIAATPWFWKAGILLTLLHAYPARSKSAREFVGLTEQQWRYRSPEHGLRQVEDFVQVNRARLLAVDIPGWLCVFIAVVLNSHDAFEAK